MQTLPTQFISKKGRRVEIVGIVELSTDHPKYVIKVDGKQQSRTFTHKELENEIDHETTPLQ